jgi:hypothetical protein
MGKSTFISAALHVAVLLWIIVAFPAAKMDSGLVAIPVDLATPSEVTKVKAGMKDAKSEGALAGKPKPPKPQAVREASPKPEETAERPKEPHGEPKAEKAAKAANKAKTAEAAKPKKLAARPAPKTRDFDADRIAALLNKIPDAEDTPPPQKEAEMTKPVHGQSNGTRISMSINELDALRARIANCWMPPPGGLGADQIVVKLHLKLNEDGTLVGYPTVANQDSSPFFQAAADSAVRAVYQCQPYELPKAKYALWRDMILNFDPSAMYRSG